MNDDFFEFLVATDTLDEFLGNEAVNVYDPKTNAFHKMPVIGKYQYQGGLDTDDLTINAIYYRVGSLKEFRIVDDNEEANVYLIDCFEKIQ